MYRSGASWCHLAMASRAFPAGQFFVDLAALG
jgi:hypothetical protein